MDPLSQLHDIQLPAPIGWWPLAIGWYLIIIGVLVLGVLVAWFFLRPKKRNLKGEVLTLLGKADYAGVSTLLRRVALHQYPNENVAGLQGEAWLAFLDKTGKTTQFTQGKGRVLLTAPYQPGAEKTDEALVEIVTQWIAVQEFS